VEGRMPGIMVVPFLREIDSLPPIFGAAIGDEQ
jgi:hypothetical protein